MSAKEPIHHSALRQLQYTTHEASSLQVLVSVLPPGDSWLVECLSHY